MVGAHVLTQTVILNATGFLTRSDQSQYDIFAFDVLRNKTNPTRQGANVRTGDSSRPAKGTLLTVKLNFVVLVTRQTEQANVPSAEGSVAHKASAGATRRFQRQHEPVAGCRAVHFYVNRAAQFLSNIGEISTSKPFSRDYPNSQSAR